MNLLGLDTSTAATVVAFGGESVVGELLLDHTGHAQAITTLIHRVLQRAQATPGDVDLVVVGVGPGPFTGLRVGVSAGLAWGAVRGIPVMGVCTFDVIAAGARRKIAERSRNEITGARNNSSGCVSVVTRARRKEIYWARYDAAGHRLAGPIVRASSAPFDIQVATDEFAGDAIAQIIDAGALDEANRQRVADTSDLSHFPDPIDLVGLVQQRIAVGEPLPDTGDFVAGLDSAIDIGQTTETQMAQWQRRDRVLLPARPLYLRRPDAVPMAERS